MRVNHNGIEMFSSVDLHLDANEGLLHLSIFTHEQRICYAIESKRRLENNRKDLLWNQVQ